MDKKQKELDDFKTIISDAGYEHSKKYFAPGSLFDVKLDVKTQQIAEESFDAGAIFMHEIIRKKDSSTIVELSSNGKLLAEKIDQYVELVSKLDDKISDYEFQIQELNKQLTQKDIVIDKYISKLHQIRGLVEKI